MPRKCIIKTCTNSENKKQQGLLPHIIFHVFPLTIAKREKWVVNLQVLANQFGVIPKGAIICSDHFDESSYIKKPHGTKVLSNTALPTLFRAASPSFSEVEIISNDCDFSKVEMIPSDCDSIKEEVAVNSQVRCVDVNAILAESGQQRRNPNFEDNESVGTDADNLPKRCNETIPSEAVVRKPTKWSWHKPICEEIDANTSDPLSQTAPTPIHLLKLPKRIRYAGDITDVHSMSRVELENCVLLCKKKVQCQSKMIKKLNRQVKAKDSQIARLRGLVKKKQIPPDQNGEIV